MGNKKFRLTNMIPNGWFYKLKDMNKTSKTLNKHHLPPSAVPSSPPMITVKTPSQPEPEYQCHSRKSYHIARELTIDHLPKSPPRKSKSSPKSRKSSRRNSPTSTCSCQSSSTFQSSRSPPRIKETDVVVKSNADNVGFLVEDALLKNVKADYADKHSILNNALAHAPEHVDIVINVEKESLRSIQLKPIITKQESKPKKHLIQQQKQSPRSRKLTIGSPGGVRLKTNSPRIIGRKQGQNGNKNVVRKSTSSKKGSISESFAVVKSSFDPQKDFRESMVEMILQNNLTATNDLQDLLACYLSLNSDEYHDVIIMVFKQIWMDLRHRK